MRRFNVTGLCVPEEDYMVDISGKIAQIRQLVDDRRYFTINRARQYWKTTTLLCLKKELADDYLVASISFAGIGDDGFESQENFCQMFLGMVRDAMELTVAPSEYVENWLDPEVTTFTKLGKHITKICKPGADGTVRKVVLMIDEVDKTSNNRVFLHFLEMLREKFLARKGGGDYTFHSVILAGVYDIKNIKLKMIGEGAYTPTAEENKLYNSPWNIAASFRVDMSFNPAEIAGMLAEYEHDRNTGMDIPGVSDEIYSYTSGYPFLVSRLCQCVDEELGGNWTPDGVKDAVRIVLDEGNTLFDDLFKNLENNDKLYDLIYDILILGRKRSYAKGNPTIDIAEMYGITMRQEQSISVSNRIFEIIICNYFVSKDEETQKEHINSVVQNDILKNGQFDMELCLRKFADHYSEIWSGRDAGFIEREGRLLFLSYLKPLINGQGFYHIESQLTDLRRMDIVVDFGREQYIIELKLWRGETSHDKAYEQLLGYLGSKGASVGYMLTFDFRRGVNKQPYAKWVERGGTRIFDVVL